MRPAVHRLLALSLLATMSACTAQTPVRRIATPAPDNLQTRRTVAPQSSETPASPLPSVPPDPPALLAQPVSLDPGSNGGKNFVVLSAALDTPVNDFSVSVASGTADPHVALRAWERSQLAGVAPPRYATQAIATPLAVGARLSFYVITSFDSNNYQDQQVTAHLQKVGTHCYVFVDDAVAQNASDATALAARLD
ncbi:MAG TPA: hypothetical protein V6D47_18340 [Oscillatoriaceae cyanobacterium]